MAGTRKRKGQYGLSLLEILMAVILLAMCIMATAMVFPGGYKLNMSNRYANQATEIARGIMDEINTRPFTTPLAVSSGIDSLSLKALDGWDYATTTAFLWPNHFYATKDAWMEGSPVRCWSTAEGHDKFFFLPEKNNTYGCPPGILVQPYPGWSTALGDTESRMAKVQITVAWKEYRGSSTTPIVKFISIVSWRTDNKLDY